MRAPVSVLPLVLILCAAAPLCADEDDRPLDVVTLENGRCVEGRVEEQPDGRLVLVQRSPSGGVSKIVLEPRDVKSVAYGAGGGATPVTSTADRLRDTWFLLRSEGRIVGTRHLEMWTRDEAPGYRIEESRVYFAQGRHVPRVTIRTVEETDLRFALDRGSYREVGEATRGGAHERYVRSVSGRVEGGVFAGSVLAGGERAHREVPMAAGTRGRLGLREHLLRRDRAVGIEDATIFDLATVAQVRVRAGFVSVGPRVVEDPAPGAPARVRRDELHWEEGGTRLISTFGAGTEPVEEALSEATVAIPASAERAAAAAENAAARARDPKQAEVKLAEGGIRFTLPDASWTWRARAARPTHTGWRVLGRAEAPVFAGDVRVELHPEGARAAPGLASARAWLLERLETASGDIQVVEDVVPLEDVPDGWRMDLVGTLRGDTKVRTVAVVVDRGDARVLLLVACPDAAWKAGRPAVERFVASIALL